MRGVWSSSGTHARGHACPGWGAVRDAEKPELLTGFGLSFFPGSLVAHGLRLAQQLQAVAPECQALGADLETISTAKVEVSLKAAEPLYYLFLALPAHWWCAQGHDQQQPLGSARVFLALVAAWGQTWFQKLVK